MPSQSGIQHTPYIHDQTGDHEILVGGQHWMGSFDNILRNVEFNIFCLTLLSSIHA